jgi:membrane associated rhomboid family serine protease
MPERQPLHRTQKQPSAFPPVIKNLLIINVLVFFAQFVAETTSTGWMIQLLSAGALYPPGSGDALAAMAQASGQVPTIFGRARPAALVMPGFQPWQVVTYAFLHADLFHILINMYVLWMFGMQIEQQWGSRRFGVYFFVCVIGAALAQVLIRWGAPVPTLGASGGVFGVLLAFGMMFPERRIMLLFPPIPIKAKWFVIGLGALELFAGVSGGQSGVANFAHLGGALAGLLLIQYWRGKLPVAPTRTMRW